MTTSARRRASRADGPTPGSRGRRLRADIQGLRALAVLAVVAGHYGVPFLRGGYVGVDVFFVISGYLISGLLLGEARRTGRVSLTGFYARRARRILPAATLVTAVTVLASAVLLSAVDARRVLTDAIWSTFFAANVHFARIGTDYFAQDELASPLQHYWSLSVEEQFYLGWPVLLLGCLVAAARWRRRSPAPGEGALPLAGIGVVLAVLGVVSFGYAAVLGHRSPATAYFSTSARAWELGLGVAASLVGPFLGAQITRRARALLGGSGLAAIIGACLFFTDASQADPLLMLIPVAGSAAVLLAGAGLGAEDVPTGPQRVLGTAPLRVVGDWSFSLYLWHWPLLQLATGHGDGLPSALERAGLVALAVVLSGLTYRYVETPLRDPARLPRRRALVLYPASVVTVALVLVVGTLYLHRPQPFAPAITVANSGVLDDPSVHLSRQADVAIVQASAEAAERHLAIPSQLQPDPYVGGFKLPPEACPYDTGSRDLCPLGDTTATRNLVVLGNSHGRMWIPAFEEIARQAGYTTYYLVKSDCTAANLVVSNRSNDNGQPWQACSDFRSWALDQIATLHPAVTVVASSGPNPVIFTADGQVGQADSRRDALVRAGWSDTLARVAATSDRVVLLRDVPHAADDPAVCLGSSSHDLGDCAFTPNPGAEEDARLSLSAAEAAGIDRVDPRRWVCADDVCPAVVGSYLPYIDRQHLSPDYVATLAEPLGHALGLLE